MENFDRVLAANQELLTKDVIDKIIGYVESFRKNRQTSTGICWAVTLVRLKIDYDVKVTVLKPDGESVSVLHFLDEVEKKVEALPNISASEYKWPQTPLGDEQRVAWLKALPEYSNNQMKLSKQQLTIVFDYCVKELEQEIEQIPKRYLRPSRGSLRRQRA